MTANGPDVKRVRSREGVGKDREVEQRDRNEDLRDGLVAAPSPERAPTARNSNSDERREGQQGPGVHPRTRDGEATARPARDEIARHARDPFRPDQRRGGRRRAAMAPRNPPAYHHLRRRAARASATEVPRAGRRARSRSARARAMPPASPPATSPTVVESAPRGCRRPRRERDAEQAECERAIRGIRPDELLAHEHSGDDSGERRPGHAGQP